MRSLPVDLVELADALDRPPELESVYLDLESGEILHLPEELEGVDYENAEAVAEAISEWDEELVKAARAASVGDEEDRYAWVPRLESWEMHRIMTEFTQSVEDEILQLRLFDALDGRGAFSRFRRVLSFVEAERKRWFAWRDRALRDEATAWLAGLDIAPRDPAV
ncbi:MAG: UPF0158 family protein [Gemmatimonadota bacterium]